MAERLVERKTGHSVPSGLSGGVATAEELHRSMVGSWRTHAEVQVAMIDSGSMVAEAVLGSHCSLVEVHISSPPFHLPFEQLLVRMPLTAED